MLYINGVSRYYLENQRKNGMKLNEELKECKIKKCNQKPLNELKINKAKNNNKSTIPISIYNNTDCSINNCKKEIIKSIKIDLNNYLLFLKYNNKKLSETKLNQIKTIRNLLKIKDMSNENLKELIKLYNNF